ncbi:MAG: peptidoglycan -binding protein [Alphaproteobacteria bacterium]|nr:peptidoglycan -binding protein [Alphaproteobacteria bacterium]
MAAIARGRRRSSGLDIWPGFVDALATLLMVIIFLLMIFTVAQFILSKALSGRDEALARLTRQVSELSNLLSLERDTNAELRLNLAQLSAELQNSVAQRDDLSARNSALSAERGALQQRIADLTQRTERFERVSRDLEDAFKVINADRGTIEAQLRELESLRRDIAALRAVRTDLEARVGALAEGLRQRETVAGQLRDRAKELEARLASEAERTQLTQRELTERDIRLRELLARVEASEGSLGQERQLSREARGQVDLLNQQILALRQQLARLALTLAASEAKAREQEVQIVDLGRRLNQALASKVEELARYRSEFFGRLREVLGQRQDIRVVGDRFVFQSEVLFETGSAELGDVGRRQISQLAATLKQIAPRIPTELNWVLQVDGHTDRIPIATERFPSNWELSAARAISVVKFLVVEGVPADRLTAAGYGEFQPLDDRDDEIGRRRNRRIELKLTNR